MAEMQNADFIEKRKKIDQIFNNKVNDEESIKYLLDKVENEGLHYEEDLKLMIYLKLKLSRLKKNPKVAAYLDKCSSAYKNYYFML